MANYHQFSTGAAKNSTSFNQLRNSITGNVKILWSEVQNTEYREHRVALGSSNSLEQDHIEEDVSANDTHTIAKRRSLAFNDPTYSKQWYLVSLFVFNFA